MHPDDTQGRSAIAALGPLAGLEIGSSVVDGLAEHLSFVLAGNARARLTAIRTFDDGVRLHVLDSLMVVPYVERSPAGPLLDMGSGGGYPGIPIALLTGRNVVLVDSVAKKMRLIQEFVDSRDDLSARVTTAAVRVESLGGWVVPGGFAVVVARALSALPSLVELAAPVLSPGGRLICMKGDLTQVELQRGDRAAKTAGLKRVVADTYELPGGDEKRAVVIYEKVGDPKISLPRREGMAQHKPLA